MNRREIIAGLGSAATWPVGAQAQQPALPLVGWLNIPVPGTMDRYLPAFKQGLADTAGSSIRLEPGWSRAFHVPCG
jgi:putative ABC transport system substrate-binding protein